MPWAGLAAWPVLLPIFLFLVSCAPVLEREVIKAPAGFPSPLADRLHLRPADYDDLPGWNVDRQGEALRAFLRSCDKMLRAKPEAEIGGVIPGTKRAWHNACEAGGAGDIQNHRAARLFFEDWFRPYAVLNNGLERGLFTGYFEPELTGSLEPDNRHDIPLYGRPADLVTASLGRFREFLADEHIAGRVVDGALIPYLTRAEIDNGALKGQNLELVWIDSAVDVFFLHIQGSGRVRLNTGEVRRIGYAASNGRPYLAIGRSLVQRGELSRDEVSMQSIRTWLEVNSAEAPGVMQENSSYIFFRWFDGNNAELGPEGAQGVPLLAGRSLAVDRRFLPLGTPIWLDGLAPHSDSAKSERVLRRLLISQDTGGAIRGPVRGDVFWGTGRNAGEIAGRMKNQGRYWLLLPRDLDVSVLVN